MTDLDSSASDAERREMSRRRTLKSGKIVYGDCRYTKDCTIRNISEAGAQVRCPDPEEVPAEFLLFDAVEATLQRCTVIWRKDRDIGLHFEGEAVSVHTSQDPRHARFRFI